MSDLISEGLTPFQRLILSRFPGQTPPADAFAGWSRQADPSVSVFDPMQSGMTLRPLGTGAGITTYGLPPNLLRGSGVVPAQRALASPQTTLGDLTGEAGLVPVPTPPDFTQDLARYGQDLRDQARNRVTQQDLSGVEAAARASGMRAGLQALPTFDATDPAYRWSEVVPQSLGAPQLVPLPTRPAPGHSALAQGIAALAGVVDPRAAGSFNAAPLQAGIEAVNTQYNDRLRQFAQAQEQRNAQYAAQRADAEQANRFALVNAEESEAAALRARQAQDAAALRSVPYASGAADAEALAASLPALGNQERTSLAGGADAAAILEKMNLVDKQYQQALEAARYTNNPLARIQVETLRQQGFYYRALLRKLEQSGTSADNGGNGTGQTPPPVQKAAVPTPGSPAATRSPAPSATPPGQPTGAPTSRYAPGNPNVPNSTSIR
ncbi:MAG: hypothetical protein JWL77_6703 [Chthonomonadaceae bacterium]|nr:hypothetical protein [Chthonomonadaceae bacterium]